MGVMLPILFSQGTAVKCWLPMVALYALHAGCAAFGDLQQVPDRDRGQTIADLLLNSKGYLEAWNKLYLHIYFLLIFDFILS